MPFVTFPDARKWQGVYDAELYKGSAVSAAKLGVERVRLPDDGNRWSHRVRGREITIGTPFVQRNHSYDPATNSFAGTPGSWQEIPRDIYQTGVIAALTRDLASDPGEQMRDPLGTPIFVDDDGDEVNDGRPNQPAVGEQARHEWTGALLWEDEAQTIQTLVLAP